MKQERRAYPSDVSEEEWEFCAPYLALMKEDAPQRKYASREIFNAVRWFVRAGCPWRMLPHDLPPWKIVQEQTLRWLRSGCFEAMAKDLRVLMRWMAERASQPTAAIMDSRTMQSTPESGARAGFDGGKKRKGSKVHIAVDTLGHLLALKVTPANEQDRAQVADLAKELQAATGESVQVAFVDQGYTGRGCRARSGRPRHPFGSGQTSRGQTRLCPAAKALGRGALLWLACAFSQTRS